MDKMSEKLIDAKYPVDSNLAVPLKYSAKQIIQNLSQLVKIKQCLVQRDY